MGSATTAGRKHVISQPRQRGLIAPMLDWGVIFPDLLTWPREATACVSLCVGVSMCHLSLGPGHTATSTGLQPMGWGPVTSDGLMPPALPSSQCPWRISHLLGPIPPPTSCPHSVSRIPALCLHGFLKPVSASGLSCCPHPVPALPDQVALRVAASGLCVRAGLWLPEPRQGPLWGHWLPTC